MGYYIQSEKINIILDKTQQKEILNFWANPSEKLREENGGFKWLSTKFPDIKNSNLKEILNWMGINHEEKENGLELTSIAGNLRFQLHLLDAAAPIISSGSFISFRGEEGEFFGLFFNGKEVMSYKSNQELKKLESAITLRDDLAENLPSNNEKSQAKIKI